MRIPRASSRGSVNHGICDTCMQEHFPDVAEVLLANHDAV